MIRARREFEMSEEDLKSLLDACRPVPVMFGSGGVPLFATQFENANRAWQALAQKMGFVWDTVRPIPGADQRRFTAEGNEAAPGCAGGKP